MHVCNNAKYELVSKLSTLQIGIPCCFCPLPKTQPLFEVLRLVDLKHPSVRLFIFIFYFQNYIQNSLILFAIVAINLHCINIIELLSHSGRSLPSAPIPDNVRRTKSLQILSVYKLNPIHNRRMVFNRINLNRSTRRMRSYSFSNSSTRIH